MRLSFFRKNKAIVGFALSATFLVPLFFSGNVSADYTNLPTALPGLKFQNNPDVDPHQYIHLSTGGSSNSYSAGDTYGDPGATLPRSYLKYYIQNINKNNTIEMRLNVVDRVRPKAKVCSGYQIEMVVTRLNSDESPTSELTTQTKNITKCVGDTGYETYVMSFDASTLIKSEVEGHRTLATAHVRFRIIDLDPGLNDPPSATFQVAASGGRLGYLASSGSYDLGSFSNGSYGSNIYGSLAGTSEAVPSESRPGPYGTNSGEVKPQHTYSMKFGVPCKYTGPSNITVRWKDSDRGRVDSPGSVSTQDTNLRISIKRYGPEGTLLDSNYTYSSLVWGTSDDEEGSLRMNVEPKYNYRIDFEKAEGGNALAFYYPFDSGDYNLNCNPPESPPSSGSAQCDNISFKIPSGGSASRQYKVYFKHRDAAGGAVGETAMISSTNKITANDTTDSSNADINIPVKDRYRTGYFEYVVLVYTDGSDNTRDPAFNVDGSLYGNIGPCYTATCAIQVSSSLGPNKAIAGQSFNVTITMTNTGVNDLPLTRSFSGTDRKLSTTIATDGRWPAPDGDSVGNLSPIFVDNYGYGFISPGGSSEPRDLSFTAPAAAGSYPITAYPDYWKAGGIGPQCPASSTSTDSVVVYEPFSFDTPTISKTFGDNESPTGISYQTTVSKAASSSSISVNNTTSRSFTARGIPTGLTSSSPPNPHTATYGGNQIYNDSYTIPAGYALGDEYCLSVTIARQSGFVGPGGPDDVINVVGPSTTGPSCGEVVDKPYLKVYGGDVVSGGGFTGINCGSGTPADSQIKAYVRPLSEHNAGTNKGGSGAQLGALALGQISGFTSASIRTSLPQLPNGLTFANAGITPSVTTTEPILGGQLNDGTLCVDQFFDEAQFRQGNPARSPVNGFSSVGALNLQTPTVANKGQTVIKPTSGKVLLGNAGAFAKKHAVFVEGDVFIKDNITYTTNWPTTNDIPSFALVVKGNIYIEKSVTQLDGMYVAQPLADGSKGRVYTCGAPSSGGSPVTDPAELYAQCGADQGNASQLTINGAVIAQRVIFNRFGNSIRNSTFREQIGGSRAAEIIRFSPEMYLSPPVFDAELSPTSGTYEYLTTLPPIL